MPVVVTAVQAAWAYVTSTQIGAFVARTILTSAFSMGVNAIFGRKPDTPQFDRGINTRLAVEPTYGRNVVYGVAKTAGSLAFADETTATDTNDTLWMVIALADHECEGVQEMQVNGESVTWASGTGVVSEFSTGGTDYLKLHFQDGAETQTAYTPLVTASSDWTSNHRGRGVCYIVVEALYNADLFSQIPQVAVVLKGKKLYDRRLDSTQTGGSGSHRSNDPSTWEWENSGTVLGDNPTLQLDDYLRGLKTVAGEVIGGVGIDADDIVSADAMTAANNCDDSITTITPAGTEKRYRSGLVLSTEATHKSNIKNILGTMAGELHDHGGRFRIFAGKARTSILTLTDDDVVREVRNGAQRIKKPWTWEPEAGREERLNIVRGRFVDETNGWRAADYPAQTNAAYKTADGGKELAGTLDLLGVPSHSQAQRLAKIYLESSRLSGKLSNVWQPAMIELESGDWCTVSSDRQGWTGGSAKTFTVEASTEYPDTMVELKLQETGTAVYAWTPGTDEQTPNSPSAPSVPAAGAAYAGKPGALYPLDTVGDSQIVSNRILLVKEASRPTATSQRLVQVGDKLYADNAETIFRINGERFSGSLASDIDVTDSAYVAVASAQLTDINEESLIYLTAVSAAFQTPNASNSTATTAQWAIWATSGSVAANARISTGGTTAMVWEGAQFGLDFAGSPILVQNNDLVEALEGGTTPRMPPFVAGVLAGLSYPVTNYYLHLAVRRTSSTGTDQIKLSGTSATQIACSTFN